jgi:hypothetical protein
MVVRVTLAAVIHFHNGDVMTVRAKRAGIPGEHIPFRESMVAGPVRPGEDFVESRARFLAGVYADDLLRVSNRLFEQEQTITQAASSGDEIVLWFEHDLFCLVHLIYLLQRLPTARTFVVWHDQPLSELEPEELWKAYHRRRAATAEMASLAGDVWRAYTSDDPTSLNPYLTVVSREFPFLSDGIALHAARFPSTRNGLGVVEQRILEFIAEGSTDFDALFNRFWRAQPRFGFGDAEILRHVHTLAARRYPLITLIEGTGTNKSAFGITDQGQKTLAGADDIEANGIDLWLGGAHLVRGNLWRWDPQKSQITAVSIH